MIQFISEIEHNMKFNTKYKYEIQEERTSFINRYEWHMIEGVFQSIW